MEVGSSRSTKVEGKHSSHLNEAGAFSERWTRRKFQGQGGQMAFKTKPVYVQF